jgi:hypothetical protein
MNTTFKGMTPELQAYLDFDSHEPGAYEERKRLKALVQPGLLKAYYRAEKDAVFVPANESTKDRWEKLSSSGQYKLVIASYETKPGCWSYIQGKVFKLGSDAPIAVVNRNYSAFPYTFVEGHPNGHDYLVCGEDYQGQTVIELDTGKRRDFLPEEAEEGFGFCWADSTFDAGSQMLVVCGCHWACPYEFRFFDFSNPMEGWPEIEAEGGVEEDSKYPTIEPDGTIKCYQTERAECDHDDCPDHCKQKPRVDAATKTFRREGMKLVLVEEWVSEQEKKVRADREEGNRKYEQWKEDFKATDPLYLAYIELVKDPALSPEDHSGLGVTYDNWCPHFTGREKRWCRRIHYKAKSTIDLEWACETGPIKLVIYRDGKHVEDKWFEHSAAAMAEAFAYAKQVLS